MGGRRRGDRIRRLLCVVLAWVVAFVVGLPYPWAGPADRQCPTAEIQTIERDGVTRAPKPGDREFVACVCQVRKSAPAKAAIAQKVKEIVVYAPAESSRSWGRVNWRSSKSIARSEDRPSSLARPPLCPPPNVA